MFFYYQIKDALKLKAYSHDDVKEHFQNQEDDIKKFVKYVLSIFIIYIFF